MISGIAAVEPYHNAVPSTAARNNAPPSKAGVSNNEDTVQLSSTARRALATALQAKPAEATETFAQTFSEAASGDLKAQAKLAKK